MPFISNIGALLGGAANEAHTVEQERFQRDQFQQKLGYDTLLHLIDDPAIGNPAIKEEALHELQGRMMGQIYPDNYSHKPGKLGKLIDQFTGMQTPPTGPLGQPLTQQGGTPMAQPGVGKGNATPTQLGGAQPAAGAAPAPAQAGPPSPGFSAMQPPQPPTMQPGQNFMDPTQSAQMAAYQKNLETYYQGQSNVAQTQGINQVKLGFDIPSLGLKKGEPMDARMIPAIDTMVKATMPEAETTTVTDPDGFKHLIMTDKNPVSKTFGQQLSATKIPIESAEIARSGPTELVRAFQRDNGRPPNQQEALAIMAQYDKTVKGATAPIQIDIGKALIDAREEAQKNLYGSNDKDTVDAYTDDIFGGRQTVQQIPAAGGLRSAVQRAFSERLASGEKPPIPLTAAGSTAVSTTEPVLKMVQRLRTEILPYAKSNVPLGTAGDALLYKLGIASDSSGAIANAELLKVLGGARVIRGASRSVQALSLAMEHLPNIKKDSGKLMYDKLDNLETNLKDVMTAAYTYEGKYGAKPNPDLDTTKPPAGGLSLQDFQDFQKGRSGRNVQ